MLKKSILLLYVSHTHIYIYMVKQNTLLLLHVHSSSGQHQGICTFLEVAMQGWGQFPWKAAVWSFGRSRGSAYRRGKALSSTRPKVEQGLEEKPLACMPSDPPRTCCIWSGHCCWPKMPTLEPLLQASRMPPSLQISTTIYRSLSLLFLFFCWWY